MPDYISFDESFKTFRIYAGKSLYAFCISPELSLEHLYWGKLLPEGFDLRYLSKSSRMTVFNTAEVLSRTADNDEMAKVIRAETIDDIQETWRNCRGVRSMSGSPVEYAGLDSSTIIQKRLENACWRAMGRKLSASEDYVPHSQLGSKDFSSGFNEEEFISASGFRHDHFDLPGRVGGNVASHSRSEGRSRSASSENPDSVSAFSPFSRDKIADRTTTNILHANSVFERNIGVIGKGELCVEYSDYGTGDFRAPSFTIGSANGYSIAPLKYVSHKIKRGKLKLPYPLPGIRSENGQDATSLVVTMADNYVGLEVDLVYVTHHQYDAITRRVVFRRIKPIGKLHNQSLANIIIERAHSCTIDFESSTAPFHLVQLNGNWARENQVMYHLSKLVSRTVIVG